MRLRNSSEILAIQASNPRCCDWMRALIFPTQKTIWTHPEMLEDSYGLDGPVLNTRNKAGSKYSASFFSKSKNSCAIEQFLKNARYRNSIFIFSNIVSITVSIYATKISSPVICRSLHVFGTVNPRKKPIPFGKYCIYSEFPDLGDWISWPSRMLFPRENCKNEERAGAGKTRFPFGLQGK